MRMVDLGRGVIAQEVVPGVYFDGASNAATIYIQVALRDLPGGLENLTTSDVTGCVQGVLDGLLHLCICPDTIMVDRYTETEPPCIGYTHDPDPEDGSVLEISPEGQG